jgi:hypothetical protein
MDPANRNRKLVADFAPQRPRLCKAQVVGVSRRPPAHETRLSRYELAVFFIAKADGLGRQVGTHGDRFFVWSLRRFVAVGILLAGLLPRRPWAGAPLACLGRPIAQRGDFRLEAGDDQCGVRRGQRVFCGHALLSPGGGVFGGTECGHEVT